MKRRSFVQTSLALMCCLGAFGSLRGAPSEAEMEAIALFEAAGARIAKNEAGHAVKVFSGGNPPHSVEELQRLAEMPELEQIALNNPQGEDGDWAFLKKLPRLKQLTIWHCKTISSLVPFSDLPIESLTVGGCMGLRDRNKEAPEKQRDAVLTLQDLPQLTAVNLYHSPLVPGDAHLAHLVSEFPALVDVKIDVASPRGAEATITAEGLRKLGELPLEVLSLENFHDFTPGHMKAIAGIGTLEAVLLDCRQKPFDTAALEAVLREARPDLEIVVAGEGASGPPRRDPKQNRKP